MNATAATSAPVLAKPTSAEISPSTPAEPAIDASTVAAGAADAPLAPPTPSSALAETAAAHAVVTGAAAAAQPVARADVGGRAPASISFLQALTGRLEVPSDGDAPAVGTDPTRATIEIETALASVQGELAEVRTQITATQSSLQAVQAQIDTDLAAARRERDTLASLTRELSSAQTRRGTVGGILTVLGFALGGPLGGVVGNAVGFGTLAAVDSLRQKIRAQETKIAQADANIRALTSRRDALTVESKTLNTRARTLESQRQELSQNIALALGVADPVGRLRGLRTTLGEAQTLLGEHRALLGDAQALHARAAALGRDVAALRAQLEKEVAAAQATLDAANAEVRDLIFTLSVRVLGAAAGLGLITDPQLRALVTGLRAARFFEAPTEKKLPLLVNGLVNTVVPADATLLEKVAARLVTGVLADPAADRARALELARSLGAAVLSEAERGAVADLLALPESVPVAAIVEGLLQLKSRV